MDAIQILIILIVVIFIIKGILSDYKKPYFKKSKHRKRKNKLKHGDYTNEYIEFVWNEIEKK